MRKRRPAVVDFGNVASLSSVQIWSGQAPLLSLTQNILIKSMFIFKKIPLRPPPLKHIKKDSTHSVHGCKIGIFSVKFEIFATF